MLVLTAKYGEPTLIGGCVLTIYPSSNPDWADRFKLRLDASADTIVVRASVLRDMLGSAGWVESSSGLWHRDETVATTREAAETSNVIGTFAATRRPR